MTNFFALALGAVLGAALRYYATLWATARVGAAFPYGTLLVNAAGSLLLGFFATLALSRAGWGAPMRLFIATGFCGSLTTFSTFSYETAILLAEGKLLSGLLNGLGSVVAGLIAVVTGVALARLIGS